MPPAHWSKARRLATQHGIRTKPAEDLWKLVHGIDRCIRLAKAQAEFDREPFQRMNNEFHRLLYSNCCNSRLEKLTETLTELPRVIRNLHQFSPTKLGVSNAAHRAILEAAIEGKADRAGSLMREHIWAASDLMLPKFVAVAAPRRPSKAASPGVSA